MNTIIATLVAVALVAGGMLWIRHGGRQDGIREAQLEATQEKSDELRESNRLLGVVRAKERENAEAAAKTAATHLKEKTSAEAERDRALADVRAGRLRLRIAEGAASRAGIVCMPAPGAGPAGGEPATQEAGFPREREEAAVRLLAESDAVVIELNKCWRTVRTDRGMPEPQ